MRASLVVVAAALGLVDAASDTLTPHRVYNKRQAFDPTETSRPGANCVEAFGEGYIECVPATDTTNRLCINPDLGQSCCSNRWGCPEDSFCLIEPLCCPNGLDPATCAAQNSVTLPADFSVSASTAGPVETATAGTSASAIPTSITASNTTAITTGPSGQVGNATGTGTPTPPVQTAWAHHETAGLAAAVLGLAAAALVL